MSNLSPISIIVNFEKFYLKNIILNKILNFLRRKDFEDICEFKVEEWKNGYAYFVAERHGRKIFIKVDSKFHFLTNDIKAYEKLSRKIPENLIDILGYEFEDGVEYLFFEYYDGFPLEQSDFLINKDKISEIYNCLVEEMILHRDLKYDNFLSNGDSLKIIDFTFSISLVDATMKDFDVSKYRECYMLDSLGRINSPGFFLWNDGYSINKLIGNKHSFFELNSYNDLTYRKTPKSLFFNFENSMRKFKKSIIKNIIK